MNIRDTFLELTSKTFPFGLEEEVIPPIYNHEVTLDQYGNRFVRIGESKTLFTSHLDTACSRQSDVNHVINGDFIETDGSTILGADDKAGVTIMLYMIEHNIPGTYAFFIGEECGGVGSSDSSKDPIWKEYDRCISFDRRAYSSVITHQGGRCCSDQFAEALCQELRLAGNMFYFPDSTGLFTDSKNFVGSISECTNISVGYFHEHTHDERQNIFFLEKLCETVLKVRWETLPKCREIQENTYLRRYFDRIESQEIDVSTFSTNEIAKQLYEMGQLRAPDIALEFEDYWDIYAELCDLVDNETPISIERWIIEEKDNADVAVACLQEHYNLMYGGSINARKAQQTIRDIQERLGSLIDNDERDYHH